MSSIESNPFFRKRSFSLFLIFLLLLSCKQTPKEKAEAVLADKNLSQEEAIHRVAEALFSEKLKDVETIPRTEGTKQNYEVYLGFGGTSALTFLESSQYSERMKLELAVSSYRFLQTLQAIPLGKFRMSLIKPFFIKNGETRGAEDFEIFRFRTRADQLKSIPGFMETDAFSTDRYEEPTEEVKTILKRIQETWEIELDQFYRIEVK